MKFTDEMCNEEFNQLPLELKRAMLLLAFEYKGSLEKHPKFPDDIIHAVSIISEESGEAIRAALQYQLEKGRFYDIHKEVIQTGAVALRFLTYHEEIPKIKLTLGRKTSMKK